MKSGDQSQIVSFAAKVITPNISDLQKAIQGFHKRNNIEDIHDLRVASRRIRVALNIFRQFLPSKKNKEWERSICKLTKSFGNARDLDVQLNFLKTFYQKDGNPIHKPGGRRLILRLNQRRENSQHLLHQTLETLDKDRTLQKMANFYQPPQTDMNIEPTSEPSTFQLSFEAINKRLEEFLFFENYLPYPDRIKELHLMRIAAKRLRYTLEIFSSLYPDNLEKLLEVMRLVQTNLGEIRDCDVWLNFLPKFLEKERNKVIKYFGNPRPYRRFIPGIQMLQEDRKTNRDLLYNNFLNNWKKWRQEEIWSKLRQTIFNPVLGNPQSKTQFTSIKPLPLEVEIKTISIKPEKLPGDPDGNH
jgi:CHAD domain-containing protein